jgi:hypothetical protein
MIKTLTAAALASLVLALTPLSASADMHHYHRHFVVHHFYHHHYVYHHHYMHHYFHHHH